MFAQDTTLSRLTLINIIRCFLTFTSARVEIISFTKLTRYRLFNTQGKSYISNIHIVVLKKTYRKYEETIFDIERSGSVSVLVRVPLRDTKSIQYSTKTIPQLFLFFFFAFFHLLESIRQVPEGCQPVGIVDQSGGGVSQAESLAADSRAQIKTHSSHGRFNLSLGTPAKYRDNRKYCLTLSLSLSLHLSV